MKISIRGVYYKDRRLASGQVVTYFYHRKTGQRIPFDPLSPEFHACKQRLDSGRPPAVSTNDRSVKALCSDFRRSVGFARLSKRTQAEYRRHMGTIETAIGNFDVSDITPNHVAKLQAKFTDRPGKSNGVARMLSRLASHAIRPLGWITTNPCVRLEPFDLGKGQRPYLETEIARFRQTVPYGTRARLVFELCLTTALRISDTVRVTADQVREMLIYIYSGKTGIPICAMPTEELRKAFEAWEAICAAEKVELKYALGATRGEPLHPRTISREMAEAYTEAGFSPSQRTHALRYTAATPLFEEGFTYDDIAEVTGHSMASMAQKYCEKKRNAKARKPLIDRIDREGASAAAG